MRNKEENTALNKLMLQFGGVQDAIVTLHSVVAKHGGKSPVDAVVAIFREIGLENVDPDNVEAIAKEAAQDAAAVTTEFSVDGSLSFIALLDGEVFNATLKQYMPQLKLQAS